jgi:hypothetical protein
LERQNYKLQAVAESNIENINRGCFLMQVPIDSLNLGACNMSARQWMKCIDTAGGGLAAAVFSLCLLAISPAAHAGSITANTATYAGDITALNFPVGTVAVSNYITYRNGGTFYESSGIADKTGKLDVITDITRVDWIAASIYGMPLVLSASLPYGYVDNAALGGQDVSTQSSFFSPNVYVTLGLMVDPQNERTLGISNYIFLPFGNYDSTNDVNVATPDQTVVSPQFAYAEGLGKFSPALNNLSIDVFGGVAFHSDGDNPVTVNGAGFDRTEQEDSYDINLYLRHNWNPLSFVAIGAEKSWGGEQIAKGGVLGLVNGDTSLGRDEYVKGHLQFGVALSETLQLAGDFTHDFYREGGFKEDFTVELRISTFIIPASGPMK